MRQQQRQNRIYATVKARQPPQVSSTASPESRSKAMVVDSALTMEVFQWSKTNPIGAGILHARAENRSSRLKKARSAISTTSKQKRGSISPEVVVIFVLSLVRGTKECRRAQIRLILVDCC